MQAQKAGSLINTGFPLVLPIFRQPSLYSKAKFFILTYFLIQGTLGLPSRSWLALYFFSLISRYSSIFKAFSMVLSSSLTCSDFLNLSNKMLKIIFVENLSINQSAFIKNITLLCKCIQHFGCPCPELCYPF